MQDFRPIAKSIVSDLQYYSIEDQVIIINECMVQAYKEGKRHLHEPHLLMGGEQKIIKERDTHCNGL